MASLPLFVEEPKEQSNALTVEWLILRNFKGIKGFELPVHRGNVDVFGDNATGKTTLFDAFLWLLFDKDSSNRKDFEIKTLGDDGQPIHGLDHEVEGHFWLRGTKHILRKVYAEKWVKQRGSAEKQFAGHETTYYVNDVPTKKQDYEKYIAGIVDEKVFRLLSDPTYFNEQLHWQERRKLLIEVCGDISDETVIAADSKLAPLRDILGNRTLDDHRKVVTAQRSKLTKEMEQIPVRISEVRRGLPDVAGLNAEAAAKELEQSRQKRQERVEQLALIQNGGQVAEKQRRLVEIETRMLEIENTYRRQNDQQHSVRLRAAQEAQAAVDAAEREMRRIDAEAEDAKAQATRLTAKISVLREQFRTVAAEEFTCAQDTACPTCGQALPEEQVEAARAKALELFNIAKAERREQINAEGKDLKAQLGLAEAAWKRCASERAAAETRLAALRKPETDNTPSVGADQDPEYKKLLAERPTIKAEIERGRGEAETTTHRDDIAQLEMAVAAAERIIAQVAQHEQGSARIAELEAEEKRLAAEFERLERDLYLTAEFVRVKVRMLTDRINSRFQHARFKLFDLQVNGALTECCETLFGGVPYGSGLNRGARLNIGLDIINALSEHYRFAAPIFVDNAEAVTQLIPVNAQLIRLVVSAPDKTLRVERKG